MQVIPSCLTTSNTVWQPILLLPVLTQFPLTHSTLDEQVAPSALLSR